MESYKLDGIEIPYTIDFIEKIDPEIVGHATLFSRAEGSIIIGEIRGRLRESLLADYRRRSPERYPELIMYSGSKQE